jgi:hypothetical protein
VIEELAAQVGKCARLRVAVVEKSFVDVGLDRVAEF